MPSTSQTPKKIRSWGFLKERGDCLLYGFWFISVLSCALQPWRIVVLQESGFSQSSCRCVITSRILWMEIDFCILERWTPCASCWAAILEHVEQNNWGIISRISGLLTWAIFLLALTSVSSTIETSVIGLTARLKMAGYLKYWATQTVTLIP